jgi:electron transport complex protein RnfD
MIGYVVLLISFPVQMTSWLPPHEIAATVPGFTDALQVIFSGHTASGNDMNALRWGSMASARPRRWIRLKRRCMPVMR